MTGKTSDRSISRSPAGFLDYASLAIATCGVGYIKLAPGTWGSAVGVGLYILWRWAAAQLFLFELRHGVGMGALVWIQTSLGLLLLVAVTLIGVAASSRVCKIWNLKDPGKIVVDEVVGQLITLSILPAFAGWKGILAGFLLFRAFDIWKPFPVRKFELLPGGLGVVMDDVFAGFYAAVVLSVLLTIRLLF